jgi:DNA-binding CsgD family transcriptional regulator
MCAVQDAPGITLGIVGREAELQTITATLRRLPTGSGGFLQIIGEPGIGKTHLLAALRALAVAQGFDVLSGRASEFERRMPFQILIEAVRDRLDGLRLDESLPPVMAEVVRSITGGVGLPESARQPSAPDIDRFRVFQALRQLLTALASRPLVILLDDAHWADPGSIDFIEYLSRRSIDVPLLIVVAHRYRQAPDQLRYALARNSDHSSVALIELGPLSRAEAAMLIRERPGSYRLEGLYRESRGNPLYLLSLDRQAAPSGLARGAGPSRRLEALILGEIMPLSAAEAAVASAAAVVGDPFSVDLLVSAANLDERAVRSALRGLMDHDLIRSVPNSPSLAFRHPLVRRVIYNRTDPSWRTEVHQRVLERLTALGSPAVELAHHIEHSVAGASAGHAVVLRQAGRESMSTSPLTAAHWFKIALSLLPGSPDYAPGSPDYAADRFELSYLLARALCLGGRLAESRDLLHEILLGVPAGCGVNRSAVVILCAHAEQRLGRYPEAIALLCREIARLGEDASHERIGLCLELGLTALLANDYPAARPEITWALAAARAADDVLGEATALAFSAFGEICAGHVQVARQAAQDSAQLVDGLPDSALVDEREALSMLGWAELLLERFADAERHLARGQAIIRRTGQSHGLPHVLLGQCLVSMFTGRITEALERAEQAEDAAHLVGSDHLLGIVLAIKSPILVWASPLGDGGAALAVARRTTELFEGSAASWWARSALLTRGHAELANGDPAACVDLLLKAGGPDLRLLGAPLLPQYAEILIGALLKLGELDQAARYAELAVGYADKLDLPGQRAHAARARGLVLAQNGDQAAAERHFAQADAWFGEAGKSVEQARTAVFAARTLASLDRFDEAFALLSRAASQAQAGGARWVCDELERVRGQLTRTGEQAAPGAPHAAVGTRSGQRRETYEPGGTPAAAQQGPDAFSALTERELEVAGLAGAGRTNRQIASRLRLSERTVESHLANVYRKLRVSSRTELARMLASRHS